MERFRGRVEHSMSHSNRRLNPQSAPVAPTMSDRPDHSLQHLAIYRTTVHVMDSHHPTHSVSPPPGAYSGNSELINLPAASGKGVNSEAMSARSFKTTPFHSTQAWALKARALFEAPKRMSASTPFRRSIHQSSSDLSRQFARRNPLPAAVLTM